MRIAVDAMGGDFAPTEVVRGALPAVNVKKGLEIVLVGREEEIRKVLRDEGVGSGPEGLTIRRASEVIEICDDPATAFKTKKDSSITVGLTMVRDGEADAFVSAGSTGALLSAATLIVKRVRGIRRAAMAPVLPTATGQAVLIDCGANAECSVEYLRQFAFLGSFYASRVLRIQNPRVGLLNIGAEPSKGDALRLETWRALEEQRQAGRLNFIGNIEAKEAIKGGCDVIVTDGFSGNIMLKTVEGMGSFLGREVKNLFTKGPETKLAALMVRNGLRDFKERLNPDKVGGTPFLGISKPVIKAHGSSKAEAIENAIYQAVSVAESGIADAIAANIQWLKAEKPEKPS